MKLQTNSRCPDLSSLDFWFWSDMERVLREMKLQTVQQIQEIVILETAAIDPSKIICGSQNFTHRVEFCHNKTSGHFEAEMKKIKMLAFLVLKFPLLVLWN